MESSDKVVETVIVGNYVEMETEGKGKDVKSKISKFFWHGGSTYDAWFSCASNQVRSKKIELIISRFIFNSAAASNGAVLMDLSFFFFFYRWRRCF